MFGREKQIIAACALYFITCLLPFAGAQTAEIVDTYPQWKLPRAAKMRLGKGDINAFQCRIAGSAVEKIPNFPNLRIRTILT